MPTLYTTIGPWTFPTFTLFLTLSVIVSVGIGLQRAARPGWIADVYLGALIGAVAGARLFHVLLNWDYFGENLNEATLVGLGGLDWHGAVIGGLAGLWAAQRARRWIGIRTTGFESLSYRFAELLDTLTPALPLISLAAWWGCLAASCGYGMEVENLSYYPAFAVSETADVYGIVAPRYNTQVFGLVLSSAVLVGVGIIFWRGWLRYRRFWIVLALLSAGMFVLGFYRGDHALMVAEIRADQVLDVVIFMVAVVVGAYRRYAPTENYAR